MPVLDWDLAKHAALAKGFRLYWEITGAMTAAVLFFGVYWLFRESIPDYPKSLFNKFHRRTDMPGDLAMVEPVDLEQARKADTHHAWFWNLFKRESYQVNVIPRL